MPGTEKTVRGFSGATLLIVDEAARVDDALYHAVRPMLAVSGGALMMLSTPYGKRGAFFDEWTNGQGWERYEIPPTGKSFEVDFCTVALWDNGQIVEENLMYDLVTFVKQIGLSD